MKKAILVQTWINRTLMILFLISTLISIVDFKYLFYGLYIAFAVGCFQILSFLITLLFYSRIKKVIQKNIRFYFLSVIIYFSIAFLFDYFRINQLRDIFVFLLFSLPVILSIFYSYILETLKK